MTERKVHRRVLERKNEWKKFGRATQVDDQEKVSYRGEEQFLIWTNQEEEDEKREVDLLYKSLVKGNHHSPYYQRPWRPKQTGATTYRGNQINGTKVKISNFPEECTEDDVRELVRDLGIITRVYYSRGIAYITFSYRDEANAALKKLNRLAYHHCILDVQEVL